MRALLLPSLCVVVACGPGGIGTFDPTQTRDAGTPSIDSITAADVGTACVYDPVVGTNPTNQCRAGMECLIVTRDGRYNPAAMALDAWEDQFSRYLPDGTDEGYCTLLGTWQSPPRCPAGTQLKRLAGGAAGGTAVCVKTCGSSTDCGRDGYVCDLRFFGDIAFPGATADPTCVVGCSFDYPQCIRTGIVALPENRGVITHVAQQDIQGASACNVGTGICDAATHAGFGGPGAACTSTNDCDFGMVCIPGFLVGGGQPGFCGAPCKPDAQNPSGTCGSDATGPFVCQAGFLLGFSNPTDPNVGDGVGFPTIDVQTLELGEAGGFCFHQCTAGSVGACDNFPGTACGSANASVFGQAWNNVSMCLPQGLRGGI